VRIVADDVTNSLVVLATKRDYQLILDVVKRLDVVPRQVMLEVTIAEITLTKDLSFGIRYALAEGNLLGTLPVKDDIFHNRPPGLPVGGLLGSATRVPEGQAFAVISDRDHFQIFLNALQSRTNVKMLSAPHIIAADNREAHILVGDSIPILTSTAASTVTTQFSTVNAIQYRDTGKILTILPQVNSKGLVNMQIRQEVSAVGATAFGNTNSPSFSTREAETTVVVQDGEGVVIGGIIDDQITHERRGVPFMMDIPFLGVAFRSDSDMTKRTELILLITPYVIRNRDEASNVTEDFSSRIEGFKRLREAMQPKHRPHPSAEAPDSQPAESTPPARRPDVVPPEGAP